METRKKKSFEKVAPVEKEKGKVETEETRKADTYLITVPTAMVKFSRNKGKKERDGKHLEPSDSSEGSFGFGPLVFPSLQRFNNIYWFNVFLMMAFFAHGKMEKQGYSGEGNSQVDVRLTYSGKERTVDEL